MSQSTTHARRASALLLILCVAALCALPWLLPAGQLVAAVQMLIAALFACAFNLLAGQGGMLSFGHAAYFGVGTFATIHAMNALGGAGLLPTPLMPLVGGVAGLLFGLVAGWFATMRSGVYFSMITLALAELLHALAPHLKGVFGGEAGLSAMRMPAWGFVRLGHRGLFPGAGLGAGVAGRAVRPDPHAAGPAHAGPARERAPPALPGLPSAHAQDAGVRAVRHVRRHRRRPAGAEHRGRQLRAVRRQAVHRRSAVRLHRRRQRLPGSGAGRVHPDLPVADAGRHHPLVAAVPGHSVRAGDAVRAGRPGRPGAARRPLAARARPGRLAAARRRVDGRRPAADGRHGLHGGTAATHVRPRLPLAAGPEPRRRLADHFPVRPRLGAAGAVDLADSAGAAGRGPRGLPLGAGAVARRRPGRPALETAQ